MTSTLKQVRVLMKEKSKGKTLRNAAMKSNMSEKTARKYLKRNEQMQDCAKAPRNYRTRQDPFSEHWTEITDMLTRSPTLEAKTILAYLMEKYKTGYKEGQVRTLHRRLVLWRAEKGPDKSIIFMQKYIPGKQSQSDWTHMNSLEVTISGEKFNHLLYHFVLSYSRFETIMVCYAESFETLTKGFEKAVFEIGGVCQEHRTDNLSAATQAYGDDRVFTLRWQEFMKHYGVMPSRNNPGESQENGKVEKSHDLFKNVVDQELLLRGSRNFHSIEEYEAFLNKIKNKRNFSRREKMAEEQQHLKSLPDKLFYEASIFKVRVTPMSLIHVLGVTYSVPSRLIGSWVKVYVYWDKLEIFLSMKLILTLPRIEAGVHIDYRHIIDGLIRKPGAFESYQHKSSLFPNISFRKAYDVLKAKGSAPKRYCELLFLAKMEGEQDVTMAIDLLLESNELPLKEQVSSLIKSFKNSIDAIEIKMPDLRSYDALLTGETS